MQMIVTFLIQCKYWLFNSRRYLIMTIPRKDDGTLNEKEISKIYIVYDLKWNAIFIVAITAFGPETEVATDSLINEIKNSVTIPFEECGIQEYVHYYHSQEQLLELRKKMKLKK